MDSELLADQPIKWFFSRQNWLNRRVAEVLYARLFIRQRWITGLKAHRQMANLNSSIPLQIPFERLLK
jgi:hypothetical protein